MKYFSAWFKSRQSYEEKGFTESVVAFLPTPHKSALLVLLLSVPALEIKHPLICFLCFFCVFCRICTSFSVLLVLTWSLCQKLSVPEHTAGFGSGQWVRNPDWVGLVHFLSTVFDVYGPGLAGVRLCFFFWVSGQNPEPCDSYYSLSLFMQHLFMCCLSTEPRWLFLFVLFLTNTNSYDIISQMTADWTTLRS